MLIRCTNMNRSERIAGKEEAIGKMTVGQDEVIGKAAPT